MDTRYAPRELEKKVSKMFTFAPRQLRWLADKSVETGASRSEILRISLDAAIRGEVAEIATPSIAEEREQVPA